LGTDTEEKYESPVITDRYLERFKWNASRMQALSLTVTGDSSVT